MVITLFRKRHRPGNKDIVLVTQAFCFFTSLLLFFGYLAEGEAFVFPN